MVYSFDKHILNTAKFHKNLKEKTYGSLYQYFIMNDSIVSITFSEQLSAQNEIDLQSYVVNFIDYTSTDQLTQYLDNSVFPFIKLLINTFAAENISMGITQANKSAAVLGLFEKKFLISGTLNAVSLKSAFDTGSLYVAKDIIQHVRDNPLEYSGLSPFVTDARLLKMKNDVERTLGLNLSQ